MRTSSGPSSCLALSLFLAAVPAQAQQTVSLSAGAASYDLSGVGTSAIVAGRYDYGVLQRLELQVGLGYFWYRSQSERTVRILLPEAGVFGRPVGSLPVYLGVGAGYALGVSGNQPDEPTLFGALGLDIRAGPAWSIRPELRVRSVDPWVGTIADFALGVRRSVGG